MIKKFYIILIVILLLLNVVLLFGNDWYSYIGKQVLITMQSGRTHQGYVIDVVYADFCRRQDQFGNCLEKEEFYTMFLRRNTNIILISCENIVKIRVIE